MAKDLVRTRRYVKKFILMRANIQAVSLKIQTLRSNNAMAQAMKGVTKAMQTMNKQVFSYDDLLFNLFYFTELDRIIKVLTITMIMLKKLYKIQKRNTFIKTESCKTLGKQWKVFSTM